MAEPSGGGSPNQVCGFIGGMGRSSSKMGVAGLGGPPGEGVQFFTIVGIGKYYMGNVMHTMDQYSGMICIFSDFDTLLGEG